MRRVQPLRLKLLVPMALTMLAPTSSKADDTDIQKDHIQTLVNQANDMKDALGGDLVNAMSLGGLSFVTLGAKAPALLDERLADQAGAGQGGVAP